MARGSSRDSSPSLVDEIRTIVRREPTFFFGVLIASGLALFAIWRVRFGLDLTDESLYVAMPLRFALGDKPFLDERSSIQGGSLLETPLVFVYHLITRDNRGLMLFCRFAYLAYLGAIGWTITRAVRGWISNGAALACASLVFFFGPYGIYNFSYNTLGAGLSMLAAFTSLRLARGGAHMELSHKTAGRLVMFAGAAACGSALSYPTLAVVVPIHFLGILVFGHRHLGVVRTALRFVAGGALLGVYVGIFVLRSGPSSLRLTLDFIRAWGSNMTGTLDGALAVMGTFKPDLWIALVILSAAVLVARRLRLFAIVIAALLPTLLAPPVNQDIRATMRFFVCLAVAAPLMALAVKDRKETLRLMLTVWVPMTCVGLVTGVSSGNGGVAAGLGGFTGMIVLAILAARASEESLSRLPFAAPFVGLVAPIVLIHALVKLVTMPGTVYCDEPIEQLTARVRTGPFAGIRTTPEKRDYIERMTADITKHVGAGKYVLAFPDLPGGYLIANRRAAIPEIWPGAIPKRQEIDAAIFRERASEVSLVIARSCAGPDHYRFCVPFRPSEAHLPLQMAVQETHKQIFVGTDYALLVPR